MSAQFKISQVLETHLSSNSPLREVEKRRGSSIYAIQFNPDEKFRGFQIVKRGQVGVVRQIFKTKGRDLVLLGNKALIIIKRPEQLLAEMTDEQRLKLIQEGHELTQYLDSDNCGGNSYRIYEEMVESLIDLKTDSRAVVVRKD